MWIHLIRLDNAIKDIQKKNPCWGPAYELTVWHEFAIVKAWLLDDVLGSWPKTHGLSLDKAINFEIEGDELIKSLPRIVESDDEESSEDEFNLLSKLQSWKSFDAINK